MPDKPVRILGIESSCDETAAAIVENGSRVLSDVVASQVDVHALYGGVVPEIASRKHLECVSQVVRKALDDAGLTLADVDAVAATYGPGLVGALLVGMSYAKGLAWAADKPVIPVNHMWGHIAAVGLEDGMQPPFLCLVVSGGHTELTLVRAWGKAEILGCAVDDAAGEAFDKSARVLGLGYPGGRRIDELAAQGNPQAYAFPRAMLKADNYDFSFSGLKTAVLTHVKQHGMADMADICAALQEAIVDVLAQKSLRAAQEYKVERVALAGGVAANKGLRTRMAQDCQAAGITLHIPAFAFCTDNAAMIAAAGYHGYMRGNFAPLELNANPALEL